MAPAGGAYRAALPLVRGAEGSDGLQAASALRMQDRTAPKPGTSGAYLL